MLTLRRGSERGHFDHGWLDTFHTFSFGSYHDAEHMQFRALRVMNDDRVEPGRGFGMHRHDNMEIITYVLDGALEHRDSLGNGSVLRAGDLQRMTAGTGIRHSEFNPSATDPVHLYQIWILPDRRDLEPGYEELRGGAPVPGAMRLVVSPEGGDDVLMVHQDVRLFLGAPAPGRPVRHSLESGRHAWLQVLRGTVTLGDRHVLTAGDGAAISQEPSLSIATDSGAEVMLFDLA